MDWKDAKDGTIQEWKRIGTSIGSAEEVVLLADINAVCDLCRAASDAAEDSSHRCESCLGFKELGGCRDANLAMTELVMDKDRDGLRVLVDEFLAALESLDTTHGKPERVPESVGSL